MRFSLPGPDAEGTDLALVICILSGSTSLRQKAAGQIQVASKSCKINVVSYILTTFILVMVCIGGDAKLCGTRGENNI